MVHIVIVYIVMAHTVIVHTVMEYAGFTEVDLQEQYLQLSKIMP